MNKRGLIAISIFWSIIIYFMFTVYLTSIFGIEVFTFMNLTPLLIWLTFFIYNAEST